MSRNRDTNGDSRPRVALLVTVVVLGMIAVRLVQRSVSQQQHKQPGPERGDLVLADDDLPPEIGAWQKRGFHPAPDPDSLPDNAVAWTHSWTYSQPGIAALAAFDQAHFVYWHELTICYEATGWTLEHRSVELSEEFPDWPFVRATFRKGELAQGTVLFSLFEDNGLPATPPGSEELEPQDGVTDRLHNRINHKKIRLPDRLLQCQVFVEHHGELADSIVKQVVALHLETRRRFRDEWIERRSPNTTADATLSSDDVLEPREAGHAK